MELITLKVSGHNDTVIDLTRPERRYNFVVQKDGVEFSLIDFYIKDGVRNTVVGQNNSGDIIFHISEISCECDENDDKIEIKLDSKATSNVEINLSDHYTWTGNSLRMTYLDSEYRNVVVSIVSPSGMAVSLKIHVANSSAIYDVVLDFGSEASQIGITRRSSEVWRVDDILPVFALIRDRYDKSIVSEQCTQYERDVYYKSQFFIPEDATSVSELSPALMPDNEGIKFLTKTADENTDDFRKKYIKLPNVKISKFSAIPLNKIYINGVLTSISGFKDDYYYRSAINIFVHTILDYLQKVADSSKCYISLTVLMPNVYSQSQVSQNLRYMSEDMDSILNTEDNPYDKIAGYEVQSISESDASFLGIMSNVEARCKDGMYLIMDAGKGTLDSSVVRVDNHGNRLYSGLFRFGSIGAGAALSYAVLICLADAFLKAALKGYNGDENLLREFIWKVILNQNNEPDLAELTAMIKVVDKYKRLIGSDHLNRDEPPIVNLKFESLDALGMNMKTFTNWASEAIDAQYIVDLSRLDVQIGEIVEDAMKKLGELPDYANKIDYIIFSGRGFLLKRFRDRMYSRLHDEFPSIQMLPCPGDMKNQCLRVINSVRANHYDGRLVGKPYVQTSVRKSIDGHSAVLKWLDRTLDNLTHKMMARTKDEFTILNPDGSNPLVYGFKDKLIGLGDTIRVGNYKYVVNNSIFKPGPVDLIFDGSDIWMRQRNVVDKLNTAQIGCVPDPIAFASLYPDVKPERIQDIPVLTPSPITNPVSQSITDTVADDNN